MHRRDSLPGSLDGTMHSLANLSSLSIIKALESSVIDVPFSDSQTVAKLFLKCTKLFDKDVRPAVDRPTTLTFFH